MKMKMIFAILLEVLIMNKRNQVALLVIALRVSKEKNLVQYLKVFVTCKV